jgi:hypothetical protein
MQAGKLPVCYFACPHSHVTVLHPWQVLLTPDPHAKASLTETIVRMWAEGSLTMPPTGKAFTVPARPARESDKVW